MEENKKKSSFVDKLKKSCVKVLKFCEGLLFPEEYKCIFCGQDIPDFQNKPYCDECEKVLSFNNKNKCLVCDEPIENEATICDVCQKNKRYFKRAFCPFVYEGVVRNAVLGYKENNQRYKAKSFAKFIVREIEESGAQIDLISFIPMTKKKEKRRSFNQSKLLAEEIGKLLNVEVVSIFNKERDDKEQKYSSYRERQEKMEGLYTLQSYPLKKSQNVLIVDDIITTCATVNYCSKLISKKVQNVYVCGIARNKLKIK